VTRPKKQLWSHVIQILKTIWDFLILDIFKMSIFHFSKIVLRKIIKNIKGIYYIFLILKEKTNKIQQQNNKLLNRYQTANIIHNLSDNNASIVRQYCDHIVIIIVIHVDNLFNI
jgi:hypothetical protein